MATSKIPYPHNRIYGSQGGGTSTSATDANNVSQMLCHFNGWYSGNQNFPSEAANTTGMLLTIPNYLGSLTSGCVQVLIIKKSTAALTFVRTHNGTSWGEWSTT